MQSSIEEGEFLEMVSYKKTASRRREAKVQPVLREATSEAGRDAKWKSATCPVAPLKSFSTMWPDLFFVKGCTKIPCLRQNARWLALDWYH